MKPSNLHRALFYGYNKARGEHLQIRITKDVLRTVNQPNAEPRSVLFLGLPCREIDPESLRPWEIQQLERSHGWPISDPWIRRNDESKSTRTI